MSVPAFNAAELAALAGAASLATSVVVEQARRATCQLSYQRVTVYTEYTTGGRRARAPCVVFEAGANSWSSVWTGAIAELSHEYRTFAYDRPGYGRSRLGDGSDGSSVAANGRRLVELLSASGAGPPYVLVSHSLGALYINQALRKLRREDVLGVVYVDGASLEAVAELRRVVPGAVPPLALARALGAAGILRALAPKVLPNYVGAFSKWPSLAAEARNVWATGEWLVAYAAEWVQAMRAVDTAPRGEHRPQWLRHVPITVIVPDVYEHTVGKEFVGAMQRILTTYSNDARLVHVRHCGHFVQIERPDVIAEAVRDVVRRAHSAEHTYAHHTHQ